MYAPVRMHRKSYCISPGSGIGDIGLGIRGGLNVSKMFKLSCGGHGTGWQADRSSFTMHPKDVDGVGNSVAPDETAL